MPENDVEFPFGKPDKEILLFVRNAPLDKIVAFIGHQNPEIRSTVWWRLKHPPLED